MACKSVERFKQGPRMWQTTDRQTDRQTTLRRNVYSSRRDRLRLREWFRLTMRRSLVTRVSVCMYVCSVTVHSVVSADDRGTTRPRRRSPHLQRPGTRCACSLQSESRDLRSFEIRFYSNQSRGPVQKFSNRSCLPIARRSQKTQTINDTHGRLS